MTTPANPAQSDLIDGLIQQNYLFRDLDNRGLTELSLGLPEKLYSNRPVYTAFHPDQRLETLYLILSGGPVVIRSTPLDRIIAISYAGSCFGMRSLPLGYGLISHAFPSQVEAYKTTSVIQLPLETVRSLYETNPVFHDRYDLLFELREKFQYHLLNCSTYPPQAVAALLRALVYQERSLGNQPNAQGVYAFDLPIDIIARASQLNHRTVEQVLKGMEKIGLLKRPQSADTSEDMVWVVDPEGLKEVYGATRDKVAWWPLK